MANLAGRRVLVVGSETELGREAAEALAEAGATLAVVSGSTEGESAFAVKRLARKLNAAASQAIDASNEAAVRVMLRQVSKELGGLYAVVDATGRGHTHLERLARRELERSGGGAFVVAEAGEDVAAAVDGGAA